MTKRIVLVSHPLRGARCSPERMADLRSARATLERLRTHKEYRNAVLVAPYLLYGEVCEDVVAARVSGRAGYRLQPHNEVCVAIDIHCEGVCAEILRAQAQNFPVSYANISALRSAA